jgi:hypothetical protein
MMKDVQVEDARKRIEELEASLAEMKSRYEIEVSEKESNQRAF